jgi:iron(III) transport system substrate-binding protein
MRSWSSARYARRGWTLALVLLGVSLGCSAAAPSNPPAPSAARSAPAAAAAPQADGAADWRREWETTLAEARKEGKVVVNAASAGIQAAIQPFEQAYPGIRLETTGFTIDSFWQRLFRERDAGVYAWDVQINSPGGGGYLAKNQGWLQPIRPNLILPEVADDSRWLGGLDGRFLDSEKRFIFAFSSSPTALAYVNRDVIPETELQNARQLTDPRFRGRIVIPEVRAGQARSQLGVMYFSYGEEFVADLLGKQDVVAVSDPRQRAEFVLRGRYPIGVGLFQSYLLQFWREGLGLGIKPVEGPLSYGAAAGALQLFDRAPNPNAAKVFINWLLTPEGQAGWAQQTTYNSARLDVAPYDPEEVIPPHRVHEYIFHSREEFGPVEERVQDLAKRLLP